MTPSPPLFHSHIPTLALSACKKFCRGVLDNAWRLASLSFTYTPTPSNHAIAERVNPHGYCCASPRVIGERRRVHLCVVACAVCCPPARPHARLNLASSPTCKRLCTTPLLHKLATTLSEPRAHSRAQGPVVVACGFCARAHPPHVFHPN